MDPERISLTGSKSRTEELADLAEWTELTGRRDGISPRSGSYDWDDDEEDWDDEDWDEEDDEEDDEM
jgi:hypothetical protein